MCMAVIFMVPGRPQGGASVHEGRLPSMQLEVPKAMLSTRIREGGAALKLLQDLTGCRVVVPPRGQTAGDVEVVKVYCIALGSPEYIRQTMQQCVRALQLICV
eukprot:gb/GFBE01062111.1/.p1 GENE.gb/GFBE01062111.1/~~gb/GFBE01062111.1/.p1  ORF type:complete len:103 (+),score=16.61 gb/GFBE01062111.1/:1-309(+)